MALRHVILGLLLERPSHPYELKQRLSPGLPRESLINDGILYPLLARLRREGLVEKSEERADSGRLRHVFRTTRAGRTDFLDWLNDPHADNDRLSYDFLARHPLVKLLFFDELSPKEQRRQLDAAADTTEEALRLLRYRASSESPSERAQALLDVLAGQLKTELQWLRALRASSRDKNLPGSVGDPLTPRTSARQPQGAGPQNLSAAKVRRRAARRGSKDARR